MNEQPNEIYDEHLSALYHAIPPVEPPEWLDRRVLMAARAAAESSVTPSRPSVPKRRPSRWAVPLALAATVVLSVGVLRLARESGELATAPSLESAKSMANHPTSSADANPPEVSQAMSAEEHTRSRAAASIPPATASMASPMVVPQSVAPPASAPLAERVHPAAAKPSGPGQPASLTSESHEAEKRSGALDRVRKEASKKEDKQSLRDSPERWLREIAELRRQGETAKAEAEWLEFKRRYPQYPLELPAASSGK